MRLMDSAWSIHAYWGFGIGFELFEENIEFSDGEEIAVEYIFINVGFMRIQRGRYAD